ncbi:hypothetical protein [Bradyrhizobium sp. Gha]|uniref:hypothetical protein n=1 Tax=Bradyrhizobium sp. Gha TaxID=1855318 RepID=UPI0008E13B40|nr:hypothetical protein [Bradyrhizobium sp. Gha]SFI32683.1 hypothetical protein SAMN05216525_107125 [Bradyrhizobium sp. Gha]
MLELKKSVNYALNHAIPWRASLQSKFPEDPRNALAVELLTRFSADADCMTEEQVAKLLPHFSWADEYWHTTLRTVVRRVGYQRTIRTFDDFVNTLVSYLQHVKAAA